MVSNTRKNLLLPGKLEPEHELIALLRDHRDLNDTYNYPPYAIVRGAGSIDPQLGSKTRWDASSYNQSVHEVRNRIEYQSGMPQTGYDTSHHGHAGHFVHVPTGANLENMSRSTPGSRVMRYWGAKEPNYYPRSDYDREEY
jgi:hypothetical protein